VSLLLYSLIYIGPQWPLYRELTASLASLPYAFFFAGLTSRHLARPMNTKRVIPYTRLGEMMDGDYKLQVQEMMKDSGYCRIKATKFV
jgi:hypothetical protein